MNEDSVEPWVAGQLALCLLAIDPVGLKGLHIRARAGAVRDAFLNGRPCVDKDERRISPSISDVQLFGGVDISGTLSSGRVVQAKGLLAQPRSILLTMAERCDTALAARLAQTLDQDAGHRLLLLDEGCEPEERAPQTLTERLAFSLSLDGLRATDLVDIAISDADIASARARFSEITVPDKAYAQMAVTAVQFGIASMRAPWMALRAAMANAALMGRKSVTDDDMKLGAQMVLAHRATQMPTTEEDEPESPDTPDNQNESDAPSPDDQSEMNIPDEMLIDAVAALLPPDLLAALADRGTSRKLGGAGGAGKRHKGNRRGRPLPSRPGHLGSTSRIDIVGTLRAAAPWQPLRKLARPDAPGVIIHPTDIYVRRFEERSDRLVIFVVDASGSAAVARLAEVKGAVELMLADAYAQRDHVALVTFRGDGADLALPPTRSLVQVKRRLAGLPGGGGTPLASGLKAAADLAQQSLGHGLSPSIALLTDGRANVALPGRTGRAAAQEDAESMARYVRRLNLPTAVVDTGNRPTATLRSLADVLGGVYLPLPRADAGKLSHAIGQALEA